MFPNEQQQQPIFSVVHERVVVAVYNTYSEYTLYTVSTKHISTIKMTLHNMILNPQQPLALYRALLRQGKLLQDYNFRSYALRRIKAGYQRHQHLQG